MAYASDTSSISQSIAMDDTSNGQESQVDWISHSRNKTELASNAVGPRPDAECYKKHERRGIAIIFNQEKFYSPGCSTRLGTNKDRDDLEEVLNRLKFDVKVYNDLIYEEIIEVLEVVSKMNHANHDCLLIAVMTHGEDGKLYAKDRPFPTRKLWTPFSGIHCPSLAGKPKLFFIQACRGDKTDPGVMVNCTETDSSQDENVYSIPVTADTLIMYSTVEGYFSWRDPKNGSYFIQSLVRQLKEHHQNRDLLSILTCVNREVAVGFTSNAPGQPLLNNKKEMCSIVSMLTRRFYFD
ncbi:hypothetical protein NQ318_016774 [Aromia moschata]|uniref:Caspase-1 n=1 Tax=Aromia moschata TaxID=1265417 RepID=A0AAV8Y692_9CUCU|nr:hypothetical protein NQ318_016774 [Aromia moschata]